MPFIRTFESVVDRLITIRKDLQQRTEQMEKSVKQAEREFSTRMKGLNDNFEVSTLPLSSVAHPSQEVSKSFGGMESRISEVGRTAIRIGICCASVKPASSDHVQVNNWNPFIRLVSERRPRTT